GKSGIAVAVTEEQVQQSQFDVIGMNLRAAGRALARWKEEKIFNLIGAMGTPVFDNLYPNQSEKGPTTGRDMTGAGNGSLSADDFFDTYAQIVYQGFTPNVVLMHPLTWSLFVKDATLRAFALQNGGGPFFASWQGSPAGRAPWGGSSMGVSGGQS